MKRVLTQSNGQIQHSENCLTTVHCTYLINKAGKKKTKTNPWRLCILSYTLSLSYTLFTHSVGRGCG